MKIELVKYYDEPGERYWYKIMNDDKFITCYQTEEEGLVAIDKYASRLKEPKIEPEIIKTIVI